jgi:hypothetical protein
MKHLLFTLLVVGLCFASPNVVRAGDADAATAPAVDTSSPKAAAISFAKAVDAGDANTAKSVTVNDPDQQKAVETMVNMFSTTKDFIAALKEKMGDEGGAMAMQMSSSLPNLIDSIKDGTETINGDTATVSAKKVDGTQDTDPPAFKKVDGKWLVDLSGSKDWVNMKSQFDKMSKQIQQMKDITAKIRSGDIKTMQDLQAAMQNMQ